LTVPPPPLLRTVPRAAERLGVSESTVWRLIRLRQLNPTCVLGRTMVSEEELQRFVAEATKPRQTPLQSITTPDMNLDEPAPQDVPVNGRRRKQVKLLK
jgi:predicted DNA-binding transcriptional regulator AlpA